MSVSDVAGPPVTFEIITPEMAENWLAHKRRNRHIRTAKVQAIARDIRDGNWHLNGDTVKFGLDGKLDDGQHRLHAVIEAGKPVPMYVLRGLSEEARHTVDSGTSRSYNDMLQMDGYVHAKTLSAVVRRMWYWDKGAYVVTGSSGDLQPTRQELDEYLKANEGTLTSAIATFCASNWATGGRMSQVTLATVAVILGRIDRETAGDFLTGLTTGQSLSAGSPVLTLRDRLARMSKQEVGSSAMGQEIRRALTFTAWNHWIEGNEVATILLPRGGLTNRNYPLPRKPSAQKKGEDQ